jgi:hypothetical protein
MKRINENLKKILSKEVNRDILKITFTVIIYLVVILIFTAGMQIRNVSKIKTKEPEVQVERFKYYVTYNGDEDEYQYTEPKTLFSIIDDLDDVDIEYTEYYEGKEIKTINKKNNFQIFVEDKKIDSNFFRKEAELLPNNTKIVIIN